MKTSRAVPALAIALAFGFGCAKKDAAPGAKSPVSTTGGSMKPAGERNPDMEGVNGPGNVEGEGVTTQSLHLSETIAQACKLAKPDATPHFDFDSANLPDGDRELLSAFARCLEGPLKGKTVLLVGRADARGESEYNMGLGEARSNVVKRYLVDLGVSAPRVTASSRGEIDATGTDESSMANDRRVDIDVR